MKNSYSLEFNQNFRINLKSYSYVRNNFVQHTLYEVIRYLVNKSDLDGTNQLFDAVRDFIGASERNPVILKTSVKKNTGISEFAKTLKDMMASKKKSKPEKDKERLETELKDIVLNNIKEKMDEMLDSDKTFSYNFV